jgi:ParB/RepB/Spo0J family partition protein
VCFRSALYYGAYHKISWGGVMATPRKSGRKKSEAELDKKRLADFLEGRKDTRLRKRRQKDKVNDAWESSVETIPIPLAALEPHPRQPRRQLTEQEVKELAESINLHALATPLLVMRRPDDSEKFYILDGIRRWHAAKMLKIEEVICNVLSQKLRNDEALALMLTMDGTRESFNPIERGKAFRVLRQDLEITQAALANLLRIPQSEISRCEILDDALHEDIVSACLGPDAHWVKLNHLRQLVRLLEIPETQLGVFRQLQKEKWVVRRLKQEVDRILLVVPLPSQLRGFEVETDIFKTTITPKTLGAINDDTIKTYYSVQ